MQAHGVAVLVNQFDAIDAAGTARGASDLMHEFEQHTGIGIRRSGAKLRFYAEMQYGEAFVRGTHENGHAQRSAEIRYREQSLHPGNVADANAQSAVLFINLRHPISFYGLLDANTDAVLVDIEEQQLLQRRTLRYGQS